MYAHIYVYAHIHAYMSDVFVCARTRACVQLYVHVYFCACMCVLGMCEEEIISEVIEMSIYIDNKVQPLRPEKSSGSITSSTTISVKTYHDALKNDKLVCSVILTAKTFCHNNL